MDVTFILMNESTKVESFNNNNTDSGFTLMYPTESEEDFQLTSQGQLNYEKLLCVLNGITIPAIAVFGLIGNLLNLVILSVRCSKKEVDVLERGALTVLIALALSDMLFCLTTLPYATFRAQNKAMFEKRDFSYYFKMYGLFFQNVFIKTSTWLTCVVGLARYVGICHPIRARIFIGIWGIRVAIISSYVVWFLFMMPLLWNYEVHHIPLTNTTTLYVFDRGLFTSSTVFGGIFSYLWFIFGYIIPIGILAFCNTCLIRALRQSVRLRNRSASCHASSQRQRDVSNRITLTLVALIVMYMVLVSPSEVLAFYSEVVESGSYTSFEATMTLANVLQAINVSFHFVLYCCVNATFRRTIYSFIYKIRCKNIKDDKSLEQRTTHSVISMRNGTATGNTSPCPHKIKMCLVSSSTTGTMI